MPQEETATARSGSFSGLTAAIDLAYLVLRYCQARPAYPNVIKMIIGEWENIEANGAFNATQGREERNEQVAVHPTDSI